MIEFIKALPILREKIFFKIQEIVDLWISKEFIDICIKENILRVVYKDIYTLSEKEININNWLLLLLPEKIFWKENTYITGKWVLCNESIIFENNSNIYFVWEKREILKTNSFSLFSQKKISKTPETIDYQFTVSNNIIDIYQRKLTIQIATIEQAIIDYFNRELYIIIDWFDEAHNFWNKAILEKVNLKKLKKMALETKDNKIIETTNNFLKWLKYE